MFRGVQKITKNSIDLILQEDKILFSNERVLKQTLLFKNR